MDTTLVLLALLAPAKPAVHFERHAEIRMVVPASRPWIHTVGYPEGADPGEKLTTCYESKSGSCWSE